MSKYNPKIVLAYFKECGLPEPMLEFKFHPERKWRFDFAFIIPSDNTFVALECEGGIYTRGAHGSISGIKRDMEKYNAAAARGWRILRVTPDDLCTQDTVTLLHQALSI